MFSLPKEEKQAIHFPHFPSRLQSFVFRASEFFSAKKLAEVLKTSEENVVKVAESMGIRKFEDSDSWLKKGYITIIRRLWHILPYSQLLELLETDEHSLAVVLREEDFLDIKLGSKPICEPITYRELTRDEVLAALPIKELMESLPTENVRPFDFKYEKPTIKFHGDAKFDTRMIYAFSGLYLKAFDVDSREYCPDEMLEAYANLGVNGIWAQAVLFQLTEFPFDKSISEGYEKRLQNMKDFSERLEKYGLKLYLYLNEPRPMNEAFFERYPHLRGHKESEDHVCMCTSVPEVQDYIENAVEKICREVKNLGGFFTITRSENLTNCYSHSFATKDRPAYTTSCPNCSKRKPEDVIAEVNAIIARGAHKVDPNIKVMAWSWRWEEKNIEIIKKLPKDVILLSQSELDIPYEIGGVRGNVLDYSISIVGPGERAKKEWQTAKARGLETGAKVQINTSWEAPTTPAIPVYDKIDEHMKGLSEEGVRHMLLSWTLGGYPSLNIMNIAKYFYEGCSLPEVSPKIKEAAKLFSDAFSEFPFYIDTLYQGPFGAGPSNLLFPVETGYKATMTCFSYDDTESWRSIYPEDVFISQIEKLTEKWEQGILLLQNEKDSETKIMGEAAYCLFSSSLNQLRFYKARREGDKSEMIENAKKEKRLAEKMLSLMEKNAAIGYEAANHYYFSKGQIKEKIINCDHIIRTLQT